VIAHHPSEAADVLAESDRRSQSKGEPGFDYGAAAGGANDVQDSVDRGDAVAEAP
jgi:hypothetical protein